VAGTVAQGDAVMAEDWFSVTGTVCQGFRVASGQNTESPYPESTIAMQMPFFYDRGLDLSGYFSGTLNVSIAPKVFTILSPYKTFPLVEWTTLHPPETFSFCRCVLTFQEKQYESLLYYPHPETKRSHFQCNSVLEILAPKLEGLGHGDGVTVSLCIAEIEIDIDC
jgi:hypothetical protein